LKVESVDEETDDRLLERWRLDSNQVRPRRAAGARPELVGGSVGRVS
jgi:hypothetical protein